VIEALDVLLTTAFWIAAIRIATPLIYGVIGELVCERAGVLNLGIEGIMTAGAMAGWMTVYFGGSLWAGVAVAALTGGGFGLIHALITVVLGRSQHVTGIGITLLATSGSYFTYRMVLPDVSSPPRIEPFPPLGWDWLQKIPFLGPVIAGQTALTVLAFVLAVLVAWVLWRTPAGLAVRAVGDNPAAADAQGIDPIRVRIAAVVAGSAIMAVGGAFLTMSAFNAFFFEMIAGRGWIAIALVVFGSWMPGKAVLGAILFGAFDAFQVRLQQSVGGAIPHQVFLMLPYLLSIAALVVMSRRASVPKALMVAYVKGQR